MKQEYSNLLNCGLSIQFVSKGRETGGFECARFSRSLLKP